MFHNLKQTRIASLLAAAALTVAILLTPAFGLPAAAQQAPQGQQPAIGVSATAGYGDDGAYIQGMWLPIRVQLTNPPGAPNVRVRVEVDSVGQNSNPIGSYSRELDLPSQSRKDVTLYAYSLSFTTVFNVRVIRDGNVIVAKKVSANGQEQGTNALVGVISSDASLLNLLRSEQIGHVPPLFVNNNYYGGPSPYGTPTTERVTVAHISGDDIPSKSAALNGFAAIVLDDADMDALTEEQYDALLDWIGRGGTLVAAARPGGAALPQRISDLLPVQIAGTRTLDNLKGLGDLVQSPITLTAPVLATNSTLKTAPADASTLLASQEGVPLVAKRDLGEGRVVYLAVSPGLAPLKGWDGLLPLFRRLLVEYKVGANFGSPGGVLVNSYRYGGFNPFGSSGIFDYSGSLFDLPALQLPDPLSVALLLLVYIIIVGPINFIILRRMRRAELAWITVPVLVLIFSAAAYFMGRGAKGGELIMIRANVAYSAPGLEAASTRQLVGLFAPLRGNYKLTVGADSLASELNLDSYGGGSSNSNPVRVTGGDSTVLDNLQINTSSLRGIMTENTLKQKPPLEAELHLGDNVIEGKVHNRSSNGFKDVALIRGGATWHISYLAPGASADVKMPVSTGTFDNTTPNNILPTPTSFSTYSGGNYSYNTSNAPPEVREYNRKINLLNIALAPLIANEAPSDMSVVALAWSTNSPVNVNVDGQFTQTEDLNLWTSRVVIEASDSGVVPRLKSSNVPLRSYMPGTEAKWYAGHPPPPANFDLYYDMQFALPAGIKPEKLSVVSPASLPEGLEFRMFNVQSGEWDFLTASSDGSQSQTTILSPGGPKNSAAYINPSGTVTVRVQSTSGGNIRTPVWIEISLNN